MKLSKIMKINIISLMMIALIILAACSSKKVDESSVVRIAFFSNVAHSQALIGKAQGNFQEALGSEHKIEWKRFDAGSTEMEAILAGEIDIGYIGPAPAINGYIKSKGDVQIITGASDAGAVLVSRKDLNIKEIKELSGKKVAVPQYGNTQDLILRYLLEENGLKDKAKGGTVEILQASNSDIKTLLDRKNIDIALVPEPWGSRLEKEIDANVILDFDNIWRKGKYSTAVVVARKEFLIKNPDVVEKFIKTHVELTDYIINNQEKAKKIVNNQIEELTNKSLSDSVLSSSFKRFTITNNPQKESIKEMMKLLVSSGYIKQEYDIKGIFQLDILNKVLKEKEENQIK